MSQDGHLKQYLFTSGGLLKATEGQSQVWRCPRECGIITLYRKDAKVKGIEQEDFYYRKCWELIGVKKQEAYNLLFENLYACDERSDTRDGRHPCFSRQVSFHPFKTTKGYEQCHMRGESVHWVAGMTINEEMPGHANYHHA